MADISPVLSIADDIPVVTWDGVSTADTMISFPVKLKSGGAIGSVQVTGTFGSSTVTLQGSNDGTNFVTLKDLTGTAISFTAAGLVDFSTAVAYIKPASSGGTADNVTVTVVLRS